MSTTVEVEVEEDVLAAAMEAAGESSPGELIERALRELIARRGGRYHVQGPAESGPETGSGS